MPTQKIVDDYDALAKAIDGLRAVNYRVVVTIGSWDLLHIGHVRYLLRAKEYGDVLVVGVDTDRGIKLYKGELRPVIPESERCEMLSYQSPVDFVTLIDDLDETIHLCEIEKRIVTGHISNDTRFKMLGSISNALQHVILAPPPYIAIHLSARFFRRVIFRVEGSSNDHALDLLTSGDRDLPLRLAEYGACYRYEQSGELFGLMRVRCLNMNDAHIYCTPEQFAAEFNAVNEMYLKYFKIFGIEKYVMRFSTHDPSRLTGDNAKFVNEPELWKQTEDLVRKVLIDSKIPYVEVPNEAAFYGPKIDVQVWSVIGREFTLATNQVDFAVPRKFGLVYRDKDNTDKTPLCIHRAPLGTHERFIGFLIEHYAGNFPLWLAPDQVRVITLNDDAALIDYAKPIVAELRANMVRVDADYSATPFKAKISNAEQLRVHTMLVIGGRDMEAGQVSVRLHHGGPQGAKPKAEVVEGILLHIKERQT